MVYRYGVDSPAEEKPAGDDIQAPASATLITLPPDAAESSSAGESRWKKMLKTAATVGVVAVAGVGLVAVGALALAAAVAGEDLPGFDPPEDAGKEKEKMMKRPGETGKIPRKEFEQDPKRYFQAHRERNKIERALG